MMSYFPQYRILGGIMFLYKISLKELYQASIGGAFWGLGWFLERPELPMACFSLLIKVKCECLTGILSD